MKTHNANIYHCESCGRVVHAEFEAKPPQCCGHTMAKACEETVHQGDVTGKGVSGHPEPVPPPVSASRAKPR